MLLELFHRAIRTGVDFFSFWRLEKALTLPVFPGTSWPAHAQYGPDAFQPLYVIVAGILCAAVGMMYQPKARLAILNCAFQSGQWQRSLQVAPQRPTHRTP